MRTHNEPNFTFYWGKIKEYVAKMLMERHPVGSVYITNTNSNPSSYLGGTWALIKRVFANKAVSDAVTWDSDNVVSGSGQAVFFVRDTRVTFRIRFTNKVAVSDTTLVMGTLSLSKVGITGVYYGVYMASDDTANAAIMMDIQSVNGETQIRTIDVACGGTVAASTSTNPTVTVTGELIFDTASIADSACNEFHWQRTA